MDKEKKMRELQNALYFSEVVFGPNLEKIVGEKRLNFWLKLIGEDPENLKEFLSRKVNSFEEQTLPEKEAIVPNRLGEEALEKVREELEFLNTYSTKHVRRVKELGVQIPFEGILLPFISMYIEKFQQQQLRKKIGPIHEEIWTQIVQDITSKLNAILHRTLILELNVARVTSQLKGDTPEERFAYYSKTYLGKREVTHRLYSEYPVVLRLLFTTISHHISFITEILERVANDREAIETEFSPCSPIGTLASLHLNSGDAHHKQRTVTILEFSSSLKLVYKPRSLKVDGVFNGLLAFLNDRTGEVIKDQYCPKVLQRDGYGYVEFVTHQSCQSLEEVSDFYERLGSLMSLSYVLNSSDFHFENIIAHGPYPVLIDLETIIHNTADSSEETSTAMDRAFRMLNDSVLSTGMLPSSIYYRDQPNMKGLNVGGVSKSEGQKTPFKVNQIANRNTDEMRIEKDHVTLSSQKNLPIFQSAAMESVHFLDQIQKGFTSMYQWIEKNKQEFKEQVRKFEGVPVRAVLRSTTRYTELLKSSYHPDLLRSALDREVLLNRLTVDSVMTPYLKEIIPLEVEDLLNGDVPYFYTLPEERALYQEASSINSTFFTTSIFHKIDQKIDKLGIEDHTQQMKILHMSMLASNANHYADVADLDIQKGHTIKNEQYVEMAKDIGDYLMELSVEGENQGEPDLCWISTVLEGSSEIIWDISPVGEDLYNGSAGVALFYAYLFKITGEKRYQEIAYKALVPVRRSVAQFQHHPNWSIGAFNGASGYLYAMGTIAALFNDERLKHEVTRSIPHIEPMIHEDKIYDYIGGSAGALKVFLSLSGLFDEPKFLELAIACSEHLMKNAIKTDQGIGWKPPWEVTPLTGFSHGVSGVMASFIELYQQTGDERLLSYIDQSLAYERSFFSEQEENWLTPNKETPVVAWCHGAPGILVSRLLLKKCGYLDEKVEKEIEVALSTTIRKGLGNNRSLCHGDFGQLEILRFAAEVLGDSYLQEVVNNLSGELYNLFKTEGYQSGTSRGTESVGLMVGLSGFGYGLLSAAYPSAVPSILTLDGEIQKYREPHEANH
jgi:type 2 lantibiotic biosynthesis protein LanM